MRSIRFSSVFDQHVEIMKNMIQLVEDPEKQELLGSTIDVKNQRELNEFINFL